MSAALIAANLLAWPVIQVSIAGIATCLDRHRFAEDRRLFRVRAWELRVFDRILRVRLWKRMLPDGAEWLKAGFPKKSLRSRDHRYLREYAIESRRGEAAHWAMLGFLPLFFLWDPPWADVVMTVYALASNVPCIVAQRYNRGRIEGLLNRLSHGPDSLGVEKVGVRVVVDR